MSYRKEFSSAFDGKQEGVFRLFESTRPVNIILRGTYGEVPIRLKVELPVSNAIKYMNWQCSMWELK